MIIQQGAKEVRLTPTILRVETAAVTFAAVLTVLREAQNAWMPHPLPR